MRRRHVDHVDRPTGIWIHCQHSPSMAGVPWYFGAAASRWSDGSLWVRESAQTTVEIGRIRQLLRIDVFLGSTCVNWLPKPITRQLSFLSGKQQDWHEESEETGKIESALKTLFLFLLLSLLLLISRIGKRSKKLHRVLRAQGLAISSPCSMPLAPGHRISAPTCCLMWALPLFCMDRWPNTRN